MASHVFVPCVQIGVRAWTGLNPQRAPGGVRGRGGEPPLPDRNVVLLTLEFGGCRGGGRWGHAWEVGVGRRTAVVVLGEKKGGGDVGLFTLLCVCVSRRLALSLCVCVCVCV